VGSDVFTDGSQTPLGFFQLLDPTIKKSHAGVFLLAGSFQNNVMIDLNNLILRTASRTGTFQSNAKRTVNYRANCSSPVG
jgi:hypothetical protein